MVTGLGCNSSGNTRVLEYNSSGTILEYAGRHYNNSGKDNSSVIAIILELQ